VIIVIEARRLHQL